MGAPVVRRDELAAELKKIRGEVRKAAATGRKKASDPDAAFVTKAELRAQFVEFARMLGIAPEAEQEQATDPASDPEGVALVEAIHERKELEAAAADVEHSEALFKDES